MTVTENMYSGSLNQYESDLREREVTQNLTVHEDSAREIFLWIAEAAISLASLFLITAVLLSFFGILDIHFL
jgi:hypothetical protein